ncbi:MAG: hypothetical protein JNL67_16915 [Planctomycetaceae bacterium]|nr:hypothetical protein [Planctomycetaceae bacterium]
MSANILRWVIGIGLAGSTLLAYLGISSWSVLRAKVDSVRPTSALVLEHEELCQAQARKVQDHVVDQHRVNAELKASQQKITAIEADIALSQTRISHMLEALKQGSEHVHVNTKVTRKRVDVERELENQVRAHRRLEQRLAAEMATTDRLRGHAQTLTTVIDKQRAMLDEMVAKSKAFAVAVSIAKMPNQALVMDTDSVEQEVLAERDRFRQLEGEIEARLQPYLFATDEAGGTPETDWDLLSKHPDAASVWIAQAQEITSNRTAQVQTADSSQNGLVSQE